MGTWEILWRWPWIIKLQIPIDGLQVTCAEQDFSLLLEPTVSLFEKCLTVNPKPCINFSPQIHHLLHYFLKAWWCPCSPSSIAGTAPPSVHCTLFSLCHLLSLCPWACFPMTFFQCFICKMLIMIVPNSGFLCRLNELIYLNYMVYTLLNGRMNKWKRKFSPALWQGPPFCSPCFQYISFQRFLHNQDRGIWTHHKPVLQGPQDKFQVLG